MRAGFGCISSVAGAARAINDQDACWPPSSSRRLERTVCWTTDDAFGFMYGTRPGAVGGCRLHFPGALVNKTGDEATRVGTK